MMLQFDRDRILEPPTLTPYFSVSGASSDIQWCFSQVKGTLEDDVTEADIISCVEFNQDGDLLATGDKGGRVVIFQRDPAVSVDLRVLFSCPSATTD